MLDAADTRKDTTHHGATSAAVSPVGKVRGFKRQYENTARDIADKKSNKQQHNNSLLICLHDGFVGVICGCADGGGTA